LIDDDDLFLSIDPQYDGGARKGAENIYFD
jgi:hypothetical protein